MLQLALDLDSDVPGIVQLMYGWSQRRGVHLGSPVSCQNMCRVLMILKMRKNKMHCKTFDNESALMVSKKVALMV